MSCSFFLARFLPLPSAKAARYVPQFCLNQLKAFKPTRPFLVLRVPASDLGLGHEDPNLPPPRESNVLFVISHQKPVGDSKECYFALTPAAPHEKRVLHVFPPLGDNLYLHTFPKLQVRDGGLVDRVNNIATSSHQLDKSSYEVFCKSVMEDHNRYLQTKRLNHPPVSGGDDAVEEDWDSWSGTDQEIINMEFEQKFKRL
jgi:hypothetical protein